MQVGKKRGCFVLTTGSLSLGAYLERRVLSALSDGSGEVREHNDKKWENHTKSF